MIINQKIMQLLLGTVAGVIQIRVMRDLDFRIDEFQHKRRLRKKSPIGFC